MSLTRLTSISFSPDFLEKPTSEAREAITALSSFFRDKANVELAYPPTWPLYRYAIGGGEIDPNDLEINRGYLYPGERAEIEALGFSTEDLGGVPRKRFAPCP